MSQNTACNQCKKEITTTNYVKCYNCNSNYHFSPCSTLAESTYQGMNGERKYSWKCHICKPRSRSANTMYQAVVFDETNNKKQERTDDDEENGVNDQCKKFKESMSLTSVNSKLSSVQNDVTELKTDLRDVKRTIEQLSISVNSSNLQIKEDIQTALTTITNTLSTLVAQVKELGEKDKEREVQINTMESRINNLEQQMISKNIEIKNVRDKQTSAYDVVKTIAVSLNVEIKQSDITKAYRLKKQ